MVVYVEYAFAENFLIDSTLLYLAFHAIKVPISKTRLIFAATVGAIVALVFPFMPFTGALELLFKGATGLLICLLAFGRLKTRNEVGRYALSVICFFGFAFAFAGGVFALSGDFAFENGSYKVFPVPASVILSCLLLFSFGCVRFIKKIYEKRALHGWIYDCFLLYGDKRLAKTGFLDSGNLAQKDGLPVCFVSPELIYELYGEKAWGQVRDELAVCTLGGEKALPLYRGELEISTKEKTLKKEVYFSPSARMISREYSILLHSRILEEEVRL